MYIKSMVIDGFKSYAQRTEIYGFDQLFNAITGLNGSGKSNILDSICFLLGITNLSHVRATNLQELVYKNGQAGITKATVSITFDNLDKKQSPLGYEQYDEITITRQVVVGGRNKYLINGSNANNTRVQDLFRSVQLNVNNPHFLIMQGRITKVLNMKPPEILSMIEEAAGTRLYESKKEAAQRTIEKKDAKLKEIDTVLKEDITPTITKLKDERSSYLEYQKINRELEHLNKLYIAYQFLCAEEKKKRSAEELTQMQEGMQRLKDRMIEIDEKVAELDKVIAELERKRDEESGNIMKKLEATLSENRKQEALAQSAVDGKKDGLKAEIKRKKELTKNSNDNTSSIKGREKDLEKLATELDALQQQSGTDQDAHVAAQKHYQAVSAGLSSNDDGQAATLNEQLITAKGEISNADTEAKQASMKLKHAQQELKKKESELKSTEQGYKKDKQTYDNVLQNLKKLEDELKKLDYEEGKDENLESQRRTLSQEVNRLQDKMETLEARFPHLHFDYRDPEKNFDRRKVSGLVCKLIKVKDVKSATALEVAAGGKLYNVVVDTEQTGKQLLQKGELRRRYTIIPLNKISSRTIPNDVVKRAEGLVGKDNVNTALSLIGYDQDLKAAMQFVFGTTFVCTDMTTAKKVTFDDRVQKRSVTLGGDSFDPAGTLTGGARSQTSSILEKLQEFTNVEQQLKEKRDKLVKVEQELHGIRGVAQRYTKLKQQYDLRQQEVEHLKEKLEQGSHHQQLEEITSLKQNIVEYEETATRTEDIKKKNLAKVKDLDNKIKNAKQIREKELKDAEHGVTQAKKKMEESSKKMKQKYQEVESIKLEMEELRKEITSYDEQLQTVEETIKQYEAQVEELNEKAGETKDVVKLAQEEVNKQKALLKACDKDIGARVSEQKTLQKEHHTAEIKIKELDNKIVKFQKDSKDAAKLVENMLQNYDWIMDEKKYFNQPNTTYDFKVNDPKESERRIQKLTETKEKLAKCVNMRAMNMLGKAEEQYTDLMKKRKIVLNDKAKISAVIIELDQKKNEALKKAWEQVNKDFGSIYSTLLPGAKAKLAPPEGMTVLDGLEVKVGFGDVWKDSLSELSGGQRSICLSPRAKSDVWQSAHGRVTQLKGPRTVIIPRTERGFGFTLRHFIVYPPEPKDVYKEREYASDDDTEDLYFQRVQQGSLEPLDTIFVKNVREGGPAHKAGLNPGDRIISVNGEPVTGKSYGQVINLIQQTNKDLSILVVPKEEDILQLAYQNSSQSYDSDFSVGHPMRESWNSSSRQSSMDNNLYISNSSRDRDRKVLSTSNLDSHYFDGSESYPQFDREPPQRRQLKSSTSYTSGLSLYRDQQQAEENMNKNVFLDRRREFESRAAQENVNPNASKTYSFGLYFPKKESQVNSAENLSRSGVVRRSKESVLQPTDSQENISKLQSSRTRNVPIEYRHSGSPDQKSERFRSQEVVTREHEATRPSSHYGQGSTVRHSFPDSGVQIWTSPTRSTSEKNSPYGFEHGTSVPDSSVNKRDSYSSSRQYVPVINESSISKTQKMSASVDSIDPRSNIYHTEHHLRTSYNKNPHPAEQQDQNQPPSSRTFIVKIGDNHERSSTPNVTQSQAGNHSYGAAFALTRSPASTEIEIRQKREPRILVSHRKKQFEERTDISPPPNSNAVNQSRYKSEIEKITTFRKFDGVQARLASYEKNSSSVDNGVRSRSQTPVSVQPVGKARRMSQERLMSPEPLQNSNSLYSEGSHQSNFSDSAPIRIYVSQGNSNTSGSPIVEIVPMLSSSYEIPESRSPGQFVAHGNQSESSREARDQTDSESGQKPVRKASFLSAVNAPYSRYLPQTGYDNETPLSDVTSKSSRSFSSNQGVSRDLREGSATPTNFQWAGRTPSPARALSPTSMSVLNGGVSMSSSITVTPVTTTHVRLRNKPEISAEDFETKLHRRTSYLMATAKDKSAVSLTMSPGSSVPLDPNTPATFNKHKSMRKLKDFFGEKTPKIVEATERRIPDPASPIQLVTKEGSLGVKVDMIDGKRASDRSWRPVWAVLRGHALYLCKERRDPANYVVHALSVKVRVGSSQQTNIFSYDEQPISIKSCIVDIAHSYTKRKNVFRVKTYNGSEYLFQAEDHEEMLSWIEKIKSNNDPDSDASGVTSSELIIRKSHELVETAMTTKTSPPQSQKMGKKLSVLSIKQKVPHSPSLKRRKTTSGEKDESGKPKTWKGKIGKSFKKQFGSSPSSSDRITPVPESVGMFGSTLDDCTPSPNNEFVPLVVDLCIQIVEAKGLEMTGVYRIPGNKAAVTLLQEEFNKGIEYMNLEHEKWMDVNVISSLLKSFFRLLPEPIIPDELYQPFIDANRIEDPERRMLKLKRLIHELPEHHFETFKHLARHLNKVALYGDINRMEAKNLAIVFGPTLIRKADDNMVDMFTDMPDHCKIIESIILHCEWFFGSWENDNYVPTDDDATECTSIISALTSSTREDIDVDPKEIVTSIVEAANRKLRGEHTPTMEKRSVSVTEPPTIFNERNIDQEILLRTRKIDNTSRSSPNLAAMQRSMDVLITSSSDISTDRRLAKSQEFCEREFSDFDFIDSEKELSNAYLNPTTRYFSDDSLLDKNDELELSHSTQSGSYNRLSRETIDSLRRIEMEARALREREERRQRDLEKRKLEKQRIEQDILQTQQELEIEDRHSVEDLLNAPDYSKFGVKQDYAHKRKIDSSVYRNTRTGDRNASSGNRYLRESPNGGKYFVIKGNSPSSYAMTSRPPRQTSVESLVVQSKRTGSLENMSDGHSQSRSHGRPLAHVRARKGEDRSKRDSSEIKRRSNGFTRTNSVRRGSLDSLIDLIEKRDSRMSWASTDSEEGLDLLTTLTSTFDQKLQTLSSPKLAQPLTLTQPLAIAPTPPRRMPYSSSNSCLSTNTIVVDSGDAPSSSQTAQHRLPPQIPLSSMMNRGSSASDLPSKQYRDPSLHRTPPKPDTKIGLATRFERTTAHNVLYEGHSEPNLNMLPRSSSNDGVNFNLQSDVTYSIDSAILNSYNRSSERIDGDSRVSSVMVVISSPPIMSADSRQGGGFSAPHYVTKPVMSTSQSSNQSKWETYVPNASTRTEFRPISKSEKTEVNVKLSQNAVDKNKLFSSIGDSDIPTSAKSRSASPPLTNRKRSEKRKRRRHTVGGTTDREHMKAITDSLPKEEQRMSAWEQLRPNLGHNSSIGPYTSMRTWLRNERLRGSSPDLYSSRRDRSNANRN